MWVERGEEENPLDCLGEIMERKQRGGLGFRDFRLFNQALPGRQAWRLHEHQDSLCATVLKAGYHPNGSLVDIVFASNASSSWHATQHDLELLRKGLIRHIDNGEQIRVWHDPWIPRPTLYRSINTWQNCRIRRVSESLDEHGSWNHELL